MSVSVKTKLKISVLKASVCHLHSYIAHYYCVLPASSDTCFPVAFMQPEIFKQKCLECLHLSRLNTKGDLLFGISFFFFWKNLPEVLQLEKTNPRFMVRLSSFTSGSG